MSAGDVTINPGKDGEFTAVFDYNAESAAAESPTLGEGQDVVSSNDGGDAETSILSNEESYSLNEMPVETSTPVLHRSVCFDSTVESDTVPLVPDDLNERASSEGTDRDQEAESEESSSYNNDNDDDDEEEEDEANSHRHANLLEHVMSMVHSRESLMVPGVLRVPIIGYETMESRSKFTIYKIHVMMGEDDTGWFVFRRYSDFVNLNELLRELFPNVRLALPPKRWFRSNFDPNFLLDRKVGLQEFLENVTGHRDICSSQPVRDFFCFDDPPSIHDSLEESRAQCECLEEVTHLMRKELAEKEIEVDLLKEEIELYKNQVRLLTERLSEYNKAFNAPEKGGLERSNSSLLPASLSLRSRSPSSTRTSDLKSPGSESNKSLAGSIKSDGPASLNTSETVLNESDTDVSDHSADLKIAKPDDADGTTKTEEDGGAGHKAKVCSAMDQETAGTDEEDAIAVGSATPERSQGTTDVEAAEDVLAPTAEQVSED